MKDSIISLNPAMVEGLCENSAMEKLQQRCQEAEAALRAIEQRNQILGDSAPFGIMTVDQEGRVQGFNRKMRDLLPWPDTNTLAEINVYKLKALVDAGVSEDFRRCAQTKRTMIRDYSCVADRDQCLQLRFYLSPVIDPTGSVDGVMAFVENHTHLVQAQVAAQESEVRYRLLFQSAPIAMMERDASVLKEHLDTLQASGVVDLNAYFNQHPDEVGRYMALVKTADCNDAFLALLETQDKEALLAELPRVVMGPAFQQMAQEIIVMVSQGRILPEREMTIRTVQGRSKRVMTRVMVLAGHETTMSRVVISMVDISTRVAAEEALRTSEQRFREQALHDNLTGLHNQRFLYQSLPRLIRTAQTQNTPVSVVFMDLDNFKSVVDAHGHLNGSRAIQEVAATLRAVIDPPAYTVAFAGDEFVVVLPDHDQEQALAKAEQMQAHIKTSVYLQGQGKNVRIQASCGIATYPTHGDNAEALLAAADTALFDIKGTGKGAIGRYKNGNQ
ncbi:MAG: diguanylate cyclase [Desulfatitalea sp.]